MTIFDRHWNYFFNGAFKNLPDLYIDLPLQVIPFNE